MGTAKSGTWNFHSGTPVSPGAAPFYHFIPLWTSWCSSFLMYYACESFTTTCKHFLSIRHQDLLNVYEKEMICILEEQKSQLGERDMWTYFSLMFSAVGFILNYSLFSTYMLLSYTCLCFWLSDLSLWSKLLYCVPALLGCPLDISNLTYPKWTFNFHSSGSSLSQWMSLSSTPFSWSANLEAILESSIFLILHILTHWRVLLVLTLK